MAEMPDMLTVDTIFSDILKLHQYSSVEFLNTSRGLATPKKYIHNLWTLFQKSFVLP